MAANSLRPAAALYGAIAGRRMRRRPDYWPPVPVICVGNFTSGGEGKTPTAIAVAEIAIGLGKRPGFLSRGYGGIEAGPVLVGGRFADPRRVGDEPCLLARVAPTMVSIDRPDGARALLEEEIDLIIMDDGLQNPHLGKDFALSVTDSDVGLRNRLVLPAGPLRAPLSAQLQHVDAIVVVGDGPAQADLVRIAARGGKRVLRARLAPLQPERWRNGKLFAFAGIGRPEKFFAALERAGGRFAGRNAFPDHHRFTEDEARLLLSHADAGEIRLVTTEKDHIRLAGTTGALAELRERSEVFAVRMEFEEPKELASMIVRVAEAVRSGRSKRRSPSAV